MNSTVHIQSCKTRSNNFVITTITSTSKIVLTLTVSLKANLPYSMKQFLTKFSSHSSSCNNEKGDWQRLTRIHLSLKILKASTNWPCISYQWLGTIDNFDKVFSHFSPVCSHLFPYVLMTNTWQWFHRIVSTVMTVTKDWHCFQWQTLSAVLTQIPPHSSSYNHNHHNHN